VGAGPEAGWYLTACPADPAASFRATTCGGASFDTVLELRTAATPEVMACNDDSSCGTQSTVDSTLPAGAGLYLLLVDGYGASDGGMVTATATVTPMAPCTSPRVMCGTACCAAGQVCVAGTCQACGAAYTGMVAPYGSAIHGGHCYLGFTERRSWTSARDQCAASGGYLAVVSSAEENTATRSATDVSAQAWIGFYDNMGASDAGTNPNAFTGVVAGTSTASYHSFGAGEPNGNPGEDCVAYFEAPFRPPGNTWNDAVCTLSYPYVCEFDRP
jgi:hypothetical protein